MPSLIINPEGSTTNGRYMIKFKKGAFCGFHRIKPLAIKYYSTVEA